jgi:hypothetical protein
VKILSCLIVVVLAGCSPYVLPALGPDHPASTSAAETPQPPASTALAGEPALSSEPPSGSGGGTRERSSGPSGRHGMHGGHR